MKQKTLKNKKYFSCDRRFLRMLKTYWNFLHFYAAWALPNVSILSMLSFFLLWRREWRQPVQRKKMRYFAYLKIKFLFIEYDLLTQYSIYLIRLPKCPTTTFENTSSVYLIHLPKCPATTFENTSLQPTLLVACFKCVFSTNKIMILRWYFVDT